MISKVISRALPFASKNICPFAFAPRRLRERVPYGPVTTWFPTVNLVQKEAVGPSVPRSAQVKAVSDLSLAGLECNEQGHKLRAVKRGVDNTPRLSFLKLNGDSGFGPIPEQLRRIIKGVSESGFGPVTHVPRQQRNGKRSGSDSRVSLRAKPKATGDPPPAATTAIHQLREITLARTDTLFGSIAAKYSKTLLSIRARTHGTMGTYLP